MPLDSTDRPATSTPARLRSPPGASDTVLRPRRRPRLRRARAPRALLSGSALGLRMRTGMEQQVLSPGCVAVLNKLLSVQAHLTTGTLISRGATETSAG